MTTIPQITKDCRAAMERSFEASKRELASIRSGKATVSLLDTIRVEAYGQQMPINQVGSISAPEPRLLTVTPWDKGLVSAIEKALRESDLGLNPQSQSGVIRVPLRRSTSSAGRSWLRSFTSWQKKPGSASGTPGQAREIS